MEFVKDELIDAKTGRPFRSWRDGKAQHNAYLEDYASLILALLSLYQSDPNPKWYQTASNLIQAMIEHFSDPDGGFFDTGDYHESLLVRPKEIQDNATPSGNSLASEALIMMAAFTGLGQMYKKAENVIRNVSDYIGKYPSAFGNWLCAMDFVIGDINQVAVIGELDKTETRELISTIWRNLQPYSVIAAAPFPAPEGSPPLLKDRPMLEGKSSAYVCRNMVCYTPTTSPQELQKQLGM
jgi:uncharacterized protein YyaL (SSP411 family)